MLLHIRQIKKCQKQIPCHINKLTTGVYVKPLPTPRFCFIRKHHNYMQKFKKVFLLSHICYYTLNKWINPPPPKKKIPCQICKVATGIYVITPTPFCNILRNWNITLNIYFCFHVYHICDYAKNGLSYLAKFINLLQAFMSPSHPNHIVNFSQNI